MHKWIDRHTLWCCKVAVIKRYHVSGYQIYFGQESHLLLNSHLPVIRDKSSRECVLFSSALFIIILI